MNILFLADIVGPAGRRAVEEHLPALRERCDADLAIVNGENIADGVGITPKLADKLLEAGADVVTLGNHTYRRSGIAGYLAASERVIRPANQGALTLGNAMAVVEARNGVRVAVLNLLTPEELSFPYENPALFVSMEDSRRLFLHPRTLRSRFVKQMQAHLTSTERALRGARIEYWQTVVTEPVTQLLAKFLSGRDRRD